MDSIAAGNDNEPQDEGLPTEAGWYRAANGSLWLHLPEGGPAGFYGTRDGIEVGIAPWLGGLEYLRSIGPFERVTGSDA